MTEPMATDCLPSVAAEVQERLLGWRAAHPRATLREIEDAADRELATLRSLLVGRLAHAGQDAGRPVCPTCGAAMQRVGTRERTVTTAQDEMLTLRGDGYRCPACGAGLFPPR